MLGRLFLGGFFVFNQARSVLKILKSLEFIFSASAINTWLGLLRPGVLSANRTWNLPDKDGTLWLNTDTVTIPWTLQFEYDFGSSSSWKTIPPDAKYLSGFCIGGGASGGSGARGVTTANRTGGSSGSAGGRTPFSFELQSVATMCGCFLPALQYQETVGGGGASVPGIATNDTDGGNSFAGGTTYIRFRATPGQGNLLTFFGCRAPGGAGGQGGRRGATASAGGGIAASGATFPGQVGQQGRAGIGNSGGAFNSGAAAGGGGGGAAGGSTVGSTGGTSGPACYDQAGDLAGATAVGVYPLPGNASTVIPAGIAGSGGAGGGYAPGLPGQPGGAGYRGGSGGGGGASDNGQTSGAGGPGGNGYILMKFSPYPMS
jgi:hypothetical protein